MGVGLVGAIELVADKETRAPLDPPGKTGPDLVARAQEHGLIRQHKAQLLVTDGRAGAHEHWINQRLVLLRVNDAVLDDVADFSQYLLDLLRQHAQEYQVAHGGHLGVVEGALDAELLLEGSQ